MRAYNATASAPASPSPRSTPPTEEDYSRAGTVSSSTTHQLHTLSMQINMNDSLYLTSSKAPLLRASFAVDSPPPEEGYSSTSPSLSTYGDISGRFSVAAYDTCLAYDSSNLPTPVSVSGSPSIPERSNRMMSPYPHHQQPSPPESSRAWNYSSAITGSPSMPGPSTGPQMMDMSMVEAPPSPEHQTTTPTPYWGQYTVSSHESDMPSMTTQPAIYPPQMYMNRGPVQDGLPSSPYPSIDLAPHHPHGPAGLNLMPPPNLENIQFDYQPTRARKQSRVRANNRTGRVTKRRHHSTSDSTTDNGLISNDPRRKRDASPGPNDPNDAPIPEKLVLTDQAPADAKFLVDIRCAENDSKGKGMWDTITKSYNSRYQANKSKETLQMTLNRAVQQFAIWPESEDQKLMEAYSEFESKRHVIIKKIMKERGGCQVWDWNLGSIARRLVELGVEVIDPKPENETRQRRKHKSTVRKKSGGESWQATTSGLKFDPSRRLTAAEDAHFFDDIKQEQTSPEADDTSDMFQHLPNSRRRAGNQSARVARQACDQMIRQNNPLYGNTVPSNGHGHLMS